MARISTALGIVLALFVTNGCSSSDGSSPAAVGVVSEVSCSDLETRTDTLNANRTNRFYSNASFLNECQFLQRQNGTRCDDNHVFNLILSVSCEDWVAGRKRAGIEDPQPAPQPQPIPDPIYTGAVPLSDIPAQKLQFHFLNWDNIRKTDLMGRENLVFVSGQLVPRQSGRPRWGGNVSCYGMSVAQVKESSVREALHPLYAFTSSGDKPNLYLNFVSTQEGQRITFTLLCSRFQGQDKISLDEVRSAFGSTLDISLTSGDRDEGRH